MIIIKIESGDVFVKRNLCVSKENDKVLNVPIIKMFVYRNDTKCNMYFDTSRGMLPNDD